jgi:hypothetical protein
VCLWRQKKPHGVVSKTCEKVACGPPHGSGEQRTGTRLTATTSRPRSAIDRKGRNDTLALPCYP